MFRLTQPSPSCFHFHLVPVFLAVVCFTPLLDTTALHPILWTVSKLIACFSWMCRNFSASFLSSERREYSPGMVHNFLGPVQGGPTQCISAFSLFLLLVFWNTWFPSEACINVFLSMSKCLWNLCIQVIGFNGLDQFLVSTCFPATFLNCHFRYLPSLKSRNKI